MQVLARFAQSPGIKSADPIHETLLVSKELCFADATNNLYLLISLHSYDFTCPLYARTLSPWCQGANPPRPMLMIGVERGEI